MRGERLDEAALSWHGIPGDRRWAFVRDGLAQSGFPWLTLRQRSDMSHYEPRFSDADHPDTSPTTVRTPAGREFDVTDPALTAELWPSGARVMRQDRGAFDTFPISMITNQTIARLGALTDLTLDVRRFRPNILVEATSEAPFEEDSWVGRTLHIGGARVRVDKRDGRCAVITIDPETSERDARVLRTVVDERDGCLGVYATTVEPGRIAIGDPVVLGVA